MKMAEVRRPTETIEPDAHLVWAPQPGPQMDMLRCPVPDILYGGSRGGGKTDALLGDWAAHAGRSGGRARGIMIRRTMPQLEEIIMRSRELYSPLGARWLAGSKSWLMPDGSYLRMRWLERDADADQYQGHSYDWVGIDEAGGFADPAPIDKMRATMRSAHKVPCVMRLTANPGGPGHQWIKERYVLPAKPRVPHYDPVRKVWRVYIPSRVHDNRALLDADPGYIDRLKSSGPAWLVRAWLDGDWDASAGDIFFTRDILLQDGVPLPVPRHIDYVFAVVDTALKDTSSMTALRCCTARGTVSAATGYGGLTGMCCRLRARCWISGSQLSSAGSRRWRWNTARATAVRGSGSRTRQAASCCCSRRNAWACRCMRSPAI